MELVCLVSHMNMYSGHIQNTDLDNFLYHWIYYFFYSLFSFDFILRIDMYVNLYRNSNMSLAQHLGKLDSQTGRQKSFHGGNEEVTSVSIEPWYQI
jgi:hypothetical protein